MVIGLILGFTVGESAERWLGWMGDIFVRLLRMVIAPLIFTSIITGVASVGAGQDLGRLGLKTFGFYMLSSLLAIMVGLALVNVIQPGAGADLAGAASSDLPEIQTPGSLGEIFIRLVPTNPVQALASGDMLGIIFFSILLGVAIPRVKHERAEDLLGLIQAAFEVIMSITSGIIRLAPLGVLGLIVRAINRSGVDALETLGMYMLTIFLGLMIHLLVTLPALLAFLGRMNPWIHFRNMSEPMLLAFSTSSSSATLPVTLRAVEKKVGVSNRVSSFVLPMGATVNMDGTALYECVGVIFISQVMGFELTFAAQITVVLTALLASIGAAGIPSAGLVMIFIVTEAVGLTGPEVAAIVGTMFAIDRPLDMLRTVVNVFSDSCGAAIIARSEGEDTVNARVVS